MEQTVENWLKTTTKELKSLGLDQTTAWHEALLLLSHVSGRKREWLVAHQEKTLLPQTKSKLRQALRRRMEHEPMAYIIGNQPFCGHDIHTDKRALIPRPETEDMTLHAIRDIQHSDGKTLVWDVGTGSGAIAISIALECPEAKIIASDVKRSALNLAKENAKANKLKRIQFTTSDLLGRNVRRIIKEIRPKHLFVIANLPYLPKSDKKRMMKDVLAFEPWSALFAEKKGLDLNTRLLKQLSKYLRKRVDMSLTLFMEFDPPQAETLRNQAKKAFPKAKIRIVKDQCGRERFLELSQ